jgi:hypothetical protein
MPAPPGLLASSDGALDPPSDVRSGSRFLRLSERMNDETDDRDADAGVGHVERGERMRQGDVQIEKQEVDDVTVQEAVGQIAHYSGEKQSERDIA